MITRFMIVNGDNADVDGGGEDNDNNNDSDDSNGLTQSTLRLL